MTELAKQSPAYRFERKFVVRDLLVSEIRRRLRLNPARFRNIYEPRFINNIYFDTPSLENYLDSIDGAPNRKKIRIRWYGDLFGHIHRPSLEVKQKRGLVGCKHIAAIDDFYLQEGADVSCIPDLRRHAIASSQVEAPFHSFRSFLLNRYRREYWLSRDGDFRITVDTEMRYFPIHRAVPSFSRGDTVPRKIIVELKYDRGVESDPSLITRHMGLRLDKSSKFVTGMNTVFEYLRAVEPD